MCLLGPLVKGAISYACHALTAMDRGFEEIVEITELYEFESRALILYQLSCARKECLVPLG